jgi:predicted ABC-type sugar transport system permease subunit
MVDDVLSARSVVEVVYANMVENVLSARSVVELLSVNMVDNALLVLFVLLPELVKTASTFTWLKGLDFILIASLATVYFIQI